jgi:hypothetical protein
MEDTTRQILSGGVSGNTTRIHPSPDNVSGSGNNLYCCEADTGYLWWTKHFDVAASAVPATVTCPGGAARGGSGPVGLRGETTNAYIVMSGGALCSIGQQHVTR